MLGPLVKREPLVAVSEHNHRNIVIGAVIGAVLGGAAGAYQARNEEKGEACLASAGTECTHTNNYFRYSAIGAVTGALLGMVVGNGA